MSMPSDFAADIIRNQSNLPQDILSQLILFYQKSIVVPEDDTVTNNLLYSPLIDLHDTTIELTAGEDIAEDVFDDQIASMAYTKVLSTPFHSDPLIYDFTNAANITFNQPDQNVGTRFSGAAITNGTDYIKIDDHPSLDITDEITISCWVYLKLGILTIGRIIHKGDSSFILDKDASDTIRFQGKVTTISYSLQHTITAEGWHHIIATAKSGTQSLYVDKILVDSGTLIGALDTDSNDIGIFATSTGTEPLALGEGISWISVIQGFADQSWVDNDFNGIRELFTRDELICFPFMQNLKAQTPITSGLFTSSP